MLFVRRMVRAVSAASIAAAVAVGCAVLPVDAVSKATITIADRPISETPQGDDVLIILASSPGSGSAKIADAIARKLDARILSPEHADPVELGSYTLIGFGSGIFDQQHHRTLLDLADKLPPGSGRRVFLFSTSGVSRRFAVDHDIDDPHGPLRDKLLAKGFVLADEFNCAGFNDNSFLKLFGGMNKGRPDRKDIELAEKFADGLVGAGFISPTSTTAAVPLR